MRSCSLPARSRWRTSVIAGTLRSRRRKSISRCSASAAARECPPAWRADPGRAQRRHVDRALHRAAKMLEDLSQVPLDLARRRQRLRPLEPDDRLLGLLVGEIELDGAAHGQHAPHQHQQEDQIFAEQAARHRQLHRWITSARNRILRGTSSDEESRRLQIDRERDVVGGLDRKVLRTCALQDPRHDAGGLDALRVQVGPIRDEPAAGHPVRGREDRRNPRLQRTCPVSPP